MSCLPLTYAPSAMPPSSSPAAIDVRLGQGSPLGSPSGPPLISGRSDSAPPLSLLGGVRSYLPSGNPPGPWSLQQVVLWWHRTPSSSQGLFFSGLGGPGLPVSYAGGWLLYPVFHIQGPGRGPQWRRPLAPVPLGQRCPQCWRRPAAKMPTPVGVNTEVLRKRTAGVCRRSPTDLLPTMSTPVPSPPATCPRLTCRRRIPLSKGSLWRPWSPCPGRSSLLLPHTAGLWPR